MAYCERPLCDQPIPPPLIKNCLELGYYPSGCSAHSLSAHSHGWMQHLRDDYEANLGSVIRDLEIEAEIDGGSQVIVREPNYSESDALLILHLCSLTPGSDPRLHSTNRFPQTSFSWSRVC
jgi:hypothetical protein